MIRTLLIANRGEIACRIIRTARQLGINTVAVYSDADRQALHVQQADTAVFIGASPATDSYLNQQRVMDAARLSGADAIHPGYGFLSENASFAERCSDAGIIFVGPSSHAITAMGAKSAAKALMVDAGVPVTPGYHGNDQSEATLQAAADDIGYPVLIKASAGGGGKGMRLVYDAAEFLAALSSVKREATASFGDDQVLIERYVTEPRHIEIQVAGDAHDHYLHLFERDCSIQRRHQKVIEEAPATGLTQAMRTAMGTAAVNAARAIAYQGVGTIEFIVDASGQFYFMEMNTRLQVEHPITEMITGVDLVAWQLSIANGDPLPMAQSDLGITGHSIEARLYSEDPGNDFLPVTGTLDIAEFPVANRTLRVETGIQSGDTIGIHYDPMIAKLVSWGPTREEARQTLTDALHQTTLAGVANNISFINAILNSDAFQAGRYTTHFIEQHADALQSVTVTEPDIQQAVVIGVLAKLRALHTNAAPTNQRNTHQNNPSPWQQHDGWRVTPFAEYSFLVSTIAPQPAVTSTTTEYRVLVQQDNEHTVITLNDTRTVTLSNRHIHWQNNTVQITDDRISLLCHTRYQQPYMIVGITKPQAKAHNGAAQYHQQVLTFHATATVPSAQTVSANSLTSPMPGQVLQINVAVGDTVDVGDTLLVVEAMKMEHAIKAPVSGTVTQLFCGERDRVDANAVLLALE